MKRGDDLTDQLEIIRDLYYEEFQVKEKCLMEEE